MAFIISLAARLERANPLPFPLLLPQILHPPLGPSSPTLPICYFSTTPKAHLPKDPVFPLDSSPNHYFHETSDFEAVETESCSFSFHSCATSRTHLSKDSFFPLDPSPNDFFYEKSDFDANDAQACSFSSYSSPPTKTHLPKEPFSALDPSSDHYFYESSDFEADEIEPCSDSELHGFLQILSQTKQFSSDEDAFDFLRESGVRLSSSLVYSAMWELRKEWRLAFLAFRWGEKCSCNSLEAWNLMVWILGKQRRLDIAWRLVRDMHRSAMVTRGALLIMIKRYAAANDASKAIKTFQALEKFKITADSTAFYTLLHALCKHKNIEEAEELMFLSKKLFPLETESFNIILNGWCNIFIDVVEAKRVWREMSNSCITPDGTSYTHMINCYSKVGNLFDSLRLYDEMKNRGWVPGLVVYNSLIYVMTKENCLKEAHNLLDKIIEMGMKPDSSTYNSIIYPLCEAEKLEEARIVYNDMMKKGLNPTIGTYHALAKVENMIGTLKLINRMREVGCGPNSLTFLLILNKLFRWGLPEKALKIWAEMKKYDVHPDSAHYFALIQGLTSCGWLNKAKEFYVEMKSRGFPGDPKLEKLLKELEANNISHGEGKGRHKKGDIHLMSRKGSTSGIRTRRPAKKLWDQSCNEAEKNKEHQEREIGRMIKYLRVKGA